MKKLKLLLASVSLTLLTACPNLSSPFSTLPKQDPIQVYFNHRQGKKIEYTEPYRKIRRSGDNLEQIITQAIDSAESTVDLATQELNLPLIALGLAKSHQRGIKVRVILENNYNFSWSELTQSQIDRLANRDRNRYEQWFTLVDINRDSQLSPTEIEQRDALTILRHAGIPILDDTADGSKGSGLMHHKFLVVDGKKVITGSSNFTFSDIHGDFLDPQTRGNHNNLLSINNREVARIFTEEFNLMWGDGYAGKLDSKFGLGKPYRSPRQISFKNTNITIQFSPTSATIPWQNSSNGLIGKILNNADRSVDLALFVFSEQNLANILDRRHQQKVQVRALIDREFAFRYYSEALDMLGFALFDRCQYETGNNPWQSPIATVGVPQIIKGDKLHHKFALIDSQITITGSHNWSDAANNNNDEALLIIDNSLVATHFQQEFERLYQGASLGLPPRIFTKQKSQQSKCF